MHSAALRNWKLDHQGLFGWANLPGFRLRRRRPDVESKVEMAVKKDIIVDSESIVAEVRPCQAMRASQ